MCKEERIEFPVNCEKSKAELLEHYAQREPIMLYQLDGHDGVVSYGIDTDEETINFTSTWELMTGVAVRVLINPKTDPAAVSRLLREIIETYETKKAKTENAMSEEERVIGSARIYVDRSVRIEFKEHATRFQRECCLCLDHIEKDLITYAYAYVGDTELGYVCPECIEGGLEGIPDRIRDACAELQTRMLQKLEILLCLHKTKELPTWEDWQKANSIAYYGTDGTPEEEKVDDCRFPR